MGARERIREISGEIDKLYEDRQVLIRNEMVTVGQILDVIKKLENSTKFSEMRFYELLIQYIDTLEEQ